PIDLTSHAKVPALESHVWEELRGSSGRSYEVLVGGATPMTKQFWHFRGMGIGCGPDIS
ncbi:hypothetical protein SK128_021331, partial [Halocaridina rubra]